MRKAINVHNYRDAVNYLFPILKQEKTTLRAFEAINDLWTEEPGTYSEEEVRIIEAEAWEVINANCGESFPVPPQNAKIGTVVNHRAKNHRVIASTWFSF